MSFNIGDTVGDYQIAGILGAGGMGKVYKVRNVISDRVEALKVLLPNLVTEPELADRFTREIKLLASLNHPNIAALHTALRVENQLLMVMEFVEGRTLEDRIKSDAGRLPAREAVDAAIQVLAALGYAHERGVVHRDIKPANMMEMPDGTVKLMDFGIAKASADRRLTMTGTTLGSLYYMSPEQVKGSATLDGRSDLYSVGVSLYELVTGTRPFKGDSDYSIMVAHLEQQPTPPMSLDPTLPPALNEIILTAIQKDPAQRFQSANAFRAALENVRPMLPETRPGMRAAAAPPLPKTPPPPPQQVPTWPQQPAAAAPPPVPKMPPPPPPAMPPPAPMMQPPPPPVPPPATKSHRGLWIGLGALIAVAVIVVAALQLPRFLGTEASAPSTSQEAAQEPAAQPPAAEATPPAAAAEQAPQPAPAEPAATAPASPAQAATAIEKSEPRRPVRQTSAAPTQPAVQTQVAPPAAGAVASPAASAPPEPSQPAKPAVDPAVMAELRERMRLLTSRANAAGRSLKTMEAGLQSQGLGLRGDISAAWDRVSESLDEARAAMKDGDEAAIRRAIENAERDVDRLDKFLGR